MSFLLEVLVVCFFFFFFRRSSSRQSKKKKKTSKTHVGDSEASALHASVKHSLSVGHVDVLGSLVPVFGFWKGVIGESLSERERKRDKNDKKEKKKNGVGSTFRRRRRPQTRKNETKSRHAPMRSQLDLFLSLFSSGA